VRIEMRGLERAMGIEPKGLALFPRPANTL
jgi:hypothetical protein